MRGNPAGRGGAIEAGATCQIMFTYIHGPTAATTVTAARCRETTGCRFDLYCSWQHGVHDSGFGPDVGSNPAVDSGGLQLPARNNDALDNAIDSDSAATEMNPEYETAWDPCGGLPMKWNSYIDNFSGAGNGQFSAPNGLIVCQVARVLSPQREDELLLLLRMIATDLRADARSRRAEARAATTTARAANTPEHRCGGQ